MIRFYKLFLIFILLTNSSYSQLELKYVDSIKAIINVNEFNIKYLEYGNALIKINPKNPWGYISTAKYYIAIKPDSSIKYLNLAIPLDNNNSTSYHLRAKAIIQRKSFGRGDCNGALEDLNNASKIDPFNYKIYNTFGEYYQYCDAKWELAIKNYNKSLDLKSSQEYILYDRAWVKRQAGDTSGSLADFNSAILLNPNEAAFYDERGKLLFEMKKYQESYDDFYKSYSHGTTYALEGVGLTATKSNKFKPAIDYFTVQLEKLTKNIAQNSDTSLNNQIVSKIYFYRGLSYYGLGDDEMAYNDWVESSIMGDDRGFKYIMDYLNRVSIESINKLYDKGKYDRAISLIYLINEKYRNKEEIIQTLAGCYYMKENYDSSAFYYKKTIDLNPTNNTALLYGAISSCNLEKYEMANNFLSKINENDKENYLIIQYYKGIIQYNLDKLDLAISYFKKVESKDTNLEFLDTQWYLGQIYHAKKDYEKSIACFSFLIENKKTDNQEYYYLGLGHYFSSEFHKAIFEFSQQIEIDSSNGLCFLYRAKSYKYLGDKENACKDFKLANSKDIAVIDKEFEEFCR
jgi:tetratricopeptide (TPR) repeat protein